MGEKGGSSGKWGSDCKDKERARDLLRSTKNRMYNIGSTKSYEYV